MFSFVGVGRGKYVMKGLSSKEVASKATHVLFAMDSMSMFGKAHYPMITLKSFDTRKTSV